MATIIPDMPDNSDGQHNNWAEVNFGGQKKPAPVIQNGARVDYHQPTIAERFAHAFGREQLANLGMYLVHDVVLPSVMWAVRSSLHRTIDAMFTPPEMRGKQNYWGMNNSVYSGGFYGYGNNVPWGNGTSQWRNPGPYGGYSGSWSGQRVTGGGNAGSGLGGSLAFGSISDCETVLAAASEIFEAQGFLRLSQLLELSNRPDLVDHTTVNRGWRSLKNFQTVDNGPEGALLIFPAQVGVGGGY